MVIPARETTSLFQNLSDQSVGVYRELCEGVDVAFEAIAARPGFLEAGHRIVEPADRSFSAKIERLETEVRRLNAEARKCEGDAAREAEISGRLQAEVERLKQMNGALMNEAQRNKVKANLFEAAVERRVMALGL